MEHDPFAVLESLTIAGYATASEKGSSTSAASTRMPPRGSSTRSILGMRTGSSGPT